MTMGQAAASGCSRAAPLPAVQGHASVAAANAVYCLRTILKDLMEQLNSAQLLSFVEVPPEALGGGGGSGGAQPPAAAPAAGEPLGSGASTPTSGGEGARGEWGKLHGGSLVQTLAREALLTLADDALL